MNQQTICKVRTRTKFLLLLIEYEFMTPSNISQSLPDLSQLSYGSFIETNDPRKTLYLPISYAEFVNLNEQCSALFQLVALFIVLVLLDQIHSDCNHIKEFC